MNNKQLAIGVVTILIVAAAATAIIVTMNSSNRGWYSWDPTVKEIDYGSVSATPNIINPVEEIYQAAYGKLPNKVSAPEGFMNYDKWISAQGNRLDVAGGKPLALRYGDLNDVSNLKIISYSSSFTETLYKILGDSVWDKVVAAGDTTWKKYPDNKMQYRTNMGSEYTPNGEEVIKCIRELSADGSKLCFVTWNYPTTDVAERMLDAISKSGYGNVAVISLDYNALTNVSDDHSLVPYENILSLTDSWGKIVNKSASSDKVISDVTDRLYTLYSNVKDGVKKTAYFEDKAHKASGSGTLMNFTFSFLNLENINKGASSVLQNEFVAGQKPNIILFDKTDPRSLDELMRVR